MRSMIFLRLPKDVFLYLRLFGHCESTGALAGVWREELLHPLMWRCGEVMMADSITDMICHEGFVST